MRGKAEKVGMWKVVIESREEKMAYDEVGSD